MAEEERSERTLITGRHEKFLASNISDHPHGARIDLNNATSGEAGSNHLLVTAQVKVNQQTNIDEMSVKSSHVADMSRTNSFCQWSANLRRPQSFFNDQI